MVVIGWVCECLGGRSLGRAKDCPLFCFIGCDMVVSLGAGGTVVWGERRLWFFRAVWCSHIYYI